MTDVASKIIQIISDTLKVDKDKITPDSSLVSDLGADSLDTVELMMALEEAFNCDIPDGEASKIVTVQDAVKYIEQKTNNS